MNRFLSDYLARYNKRIVTTGIVSLVLGAGLLLANVNFAYNAICGPFPTTSEELEKFTGGGLFPKYFVLVKGLNVIHTGLAWQRVRKHSKKDKDSQDDSQSDSAESAESPEYYMDFLLIPKHLLPIKTSTLTDDPVIIGELKIPNESTMTLLRSTTSQKDIADRIMNLQLDQSNSFKALFWMLLILITGLSLFGLFKLLTVLVAWKDLEKHPLGQAIAKTGGFNSMRIEIEQDFSHTPPSDSGKKVICGTKWILLEEANTPKFIPFKNVVWIYASNAPTTQFFTTTNVYSLIICTTEGVEHKIAMPKSDVDTMIENIGKNVPWAMIGFEGPRALRWNAHKQKLIAEIAQKRDQLLRKA